MFYRFEVQQIEEFCAPRGASCSRRKGDRNCGTFHGHRWKQRAVTNDREAAVSYIKGLGDSWRVYDHVEDEIIQI